MEAAIAAFCSVDLEMQSLFLRKSATAKYCDPFPDHALTLGSCSASTAFEIQHGSFQWQLYFCFDDRFPVPPCHYVCLNVLIMHPLSFLGFVGIVSLGAVKTWSKEAEGLHQVSSSVPGGMKPPDEMVPIESADKWSLL